MSRYTGPKLRILRRLGCELPGLTSKSTARRPSPPGQAAATSKRFPKLSEHGARMREKQKLRFHYGLSERALRLVYERAVRMYKDTAKGMVELLESRLDNIVWRSGYARTIPAARQLIAHGHIFLRGRRARSPGQMVKIGDVITLAQGSMGREDIRVSLNNPVLDPPSGLKRDLDKLSVTIESLPTADMIPFSMEIQKVIEYYAR